MCAYVLMEIFEINHSSLDLSPRAAEDHSSTLGKSHDYLVCL